MIGSKRQVVAQVVVSVLLLVALVVAAALQWQEIKSGLAKISLGLAAAMTALQVLGLALRAEALGVPLRSGGAHFARSDLHLASAASFLANCFVPVYVGQLVHIAMLQRKSRKTSPMQIIVADSAVFYSEMVLFAVFVLLLFSSLPWGSWPVFGFVALLMIVAVAFFWVSKKHGHLFWTRPLRVFSERGSRWYFAFLVVAIVIIQPLRFWLLFSAILPSGEVRYALLAWVGSSVAQVLPIGPGPAIAAGALATTPISFADATLTGLVFAATFVLAALIYLGGTEMWSVAKEAARRRG